MCVMATCLHALCHKCRNQERTVLYVTEIMHAAQFERAGEEFKLDGQSRIHLQSEAPAGNITVTLAFDYPLSSGLSGFYRTEYLDGGGFSRVIAATQFEAMSARKAFPCLDEPALKVSLLFILSIKIACVGYSHGTNVSMQCRYSM